MTVGAQIARLHIAMLNIVDAVIADPEHRQSVRKLVNTEFSRFGKDENEQRVIPPPPSPPGPEKVLKGG